MMSVFCILKYASGWEEDASDVRVAALQETPTNSSQESATISSAASLIKDPKWYEQRAKLAAEIKDGREHNEEANYLLDLAATEDEKAFKKAWLNECYEPAAPTEEQQNEQDLEEAEEMMLSAKPCSKLNQ